MRMREPRFTAHYCEMHPDANAPSLAWDGGFRSQFGAYPGAWLPIDAGVETPTPRGWHQVAIRSRLGRAVNRYRTATEAGGAASRHLARGSDDRARNVTTLADVGCERPAPALVRNNGGASRTTTDAAPTSARSPDRAGALRCRSRPTARCVRRHQCALRGRRGHRLDDAIVIHGRTALENDALSDSRRRLQPRIPQDRCGV